MALALATLIRRTVARVWVLGAVLAGLLAAFQLALVAVAASLASTGGFERLAGLAPAFIQQAFGPALTTFGGMATLGFFEPLIVILVVTYAIHVASEPAGDVESGLVDLMLARPLPRHLLLTRSLIVMTGSTVVLPLAMGLSLWAGLSWLAPADQRWPDLRVVMMLMANLAAVAWCFGGVALAAAAFSRRRGSATTIVAVGCVAMYLAETVGEAWPARAGWASWLSPFHRFHGAAIIAGDAHSASDFTILLTIGAAGVALAYWQYQRRDV
jgi:hypothetical protein